MSIQQLEQRHIDLSKIPPIEANRLTSFVNHFAITIIKQLNNLVEVADRRLYQIHCRIATCKTNLLILERKLNSVPGLTSLSNEVTVTQQPSRQPLITEHVELVNPAEPSSISVANREVEETLQAPPELGPADNPELQKYYKMLKVGVPLAAVRMKMSAEGFDPDLLKV